MDIETTINRVFRDMKKQHILMSDVDEDAKEFLRQVWVAGYEQKTEQAGIWYGKKIGQYDINGKLIAVYSNVFMAEKVTAFKVRSIHISLEHGKPNKQGWIWKYIIDDEKETRRQPDKRNRSNAYSGMVSEPIQEKEINQEAENA